MQQMPLRSLLQSESALAQTPNRQSPDAIVRWNSLTLDIIKAEKTSPPMAARNLGMVHAAAYDAANAVLKAQKVYKVEVQPPAGATAQVTYTPTNQPGFWQPIPPELKPASMPHWKNVKPFAMTKGSQFQIANMPSLTSEEYTTEFNKLKELGAKNSKIRTADQSAIAVFWLNNPGTLTPPGHWNQIAADVAVRRGNTFAQNLRLFAILNIALADASIIDGDTKYTFNRWRPLTGIQQAEKDGNPQTTADPNWTPLLNTPSSPAYVSGHSTFAGAADAVLTAFFGNNVSFTAVADPSVNLPPRNLKSFTEAAEEAGMSRVYGGAHWHSDNRDGLKAGRNLGKYVVDNF
ncbi:MAG: vanadium-dependent haloperoxidase [Oscillatoriales cyanobacterium RU_3_3]|nr:vanadium-dependent haloperoxidase [Oscillatoriales cyanobacterium RU_3_3]